MNNSLPHDDDNADSRFSRVISIDKWYIKTNDLDPAMFGTTFRLYPLTYQRNVPGGYYMYTKWELYGCELEV